MDGNATPRVKGYAYCATPQIEPGVGASPLMTWGEVESTPQRIEGTTPVRHSGPAFKIPQVCDKCLLSLIILCRHVLLRFIDV